MYLAVGFSRTEGAATETIYAAKTSKGVFCLDEQVLLQRVEKVHEVRGL